MHRNRVRVLFIALVGIAVAGAFGLSVAERASPYGDTDPASQSVRPRTATSGATGRQIDPGVIALVRTGGVHRAASNAASARSRPSCARVATSPKCRAITTATTQPRSPLTDGRPTSPRTTSRSRTRGSRTTPRASRARFAAPARRSARRIGHRERTGEHAGQATTSAGPSCSPFR